MARNGRPGLTKPTTGIAGCCARTASGQVAAAPLRSEMKSRRLMLAPSIAYQREARCASQQIGGARRPLWVKSRHGALKFQCPLYPRLCCKTRMYLPTRCRLYFCRALFRCPDEGVAASTHRYQRLTHQLCWTGRRQWRWTAKKFDEPPQVLRGCCEQDLVPRTGQASQSKPVEPEDTLHMRKSHLDLLALAV